MTLRAWKERVIYIMGSGEQWRPFVHINDVVQALLLGVEEEAERVAGEIFNVGSDELNYQIRHLAQFVLDVIRACDGPPDPRRSGQTHLQSVLCEDQAAPRLLGLLTGAILYISSLVGFAEPARAISAPITIAFTSFLVMLLAVIWREVMQTQRYARGQPPFSIAAIWRDRGDGTSGPETGPGCRFARLAPGARLESGGEFG
jgi:hypothetical protein